MFDKRAERIARECGILDRMEALEAELMKIEGIVEVPFDLDNYGDSGMYQVILVPKYDIDVRREDYFEARRQQRQAIIEACLRHDLWPTGDRIEDYGEHWYMVRRCGDTWPRVERDFGERKGA